MSVGCWLWCCYKHVPAAAQQAALQCWQRGWTAAALHNGCDRHRIVGVWLCDHYNHAVTGGISILRTLTECHFYVPATFCCSARLQCRFPAFVCAAYRSCTPGCMISQQSAKLCCLAELFHSSLRQLNLACHVGTRHPGVGINYTTTASVLIFDLIACACVALEGGTR